LIAGEDHGTPEEDFRDGGPVPMTHPEECCGKVLVAHRDAMDKDDVFDGQARCSVFAVHPLALIAYGRAFYCS
jgi:hypothetical protein